MYNTIKYSGGTVASFACSALSSANHTTFICTSDLCSFTKADSQLKTLGQDFLIRMSPQRSSWRRPRHAKEQQANTSGTTAQQSADLRHQFVNGCIYIALLSKALYSCLRCIHRRRRHLGLGGVLPRDTSTLS